MPLTLFYELFRRIELDIGMTLLREMKSTYNNQ